jgi:hypothetical protein
MTIPADFNYENEDDFNQRFLIPLLLRLGFSVIANFHGHSEFGKDIVFAEIDRFGHIRYNAIQSKYVASIGLNAVEELILDCKQAFAHEFRHPQTGSQERISSFYAVNGGSISEQAIQHFFATLQPCYGANVRILQAKDLLVLDRWSATKGRADELRILTGVLLEVRFNRRQLNKVVFDMEKSISKSGHFYPFTSVKADAISAFLTLPVYLDPPLIQLAEQYWSLLSAVADLTATYRSRRKTTPEDARELLEAFKSVHVKIENNGTAIERILTEVISRLSPPSQGGG